MAPAYLAAVIRAKQRPPVRVLLLLMAALSAAGPLLPAPAPGMSFRAVASVALGQAPVAIAIADLNADGRPDFVTANSGSMDVSVLLGNGDGTFATAQTVPIRVQGFSVEAFSVAPGDFNGDGVVDLAVGCRESCGTVFILLGQGDGTFAEPLWFFAGRGPASVAVADFDGDGRLDLAAANFFNANIVVLLGNGDGTLQARRIVSEVPAGVAPVTAADLNGDKALDLVVGTGSGVAVQLGRGDGSFGPAQTFGSGIVAIALGIGDLNRDNAPDVVVGDPVASNIGVLLGRGDGTFAPAQFFMAGQQPLAVAVADVTGDGLADVVTANVASDDISVLPGSGDGTFAAASSLPAGAGPVGLAVADLNGDGWPDIVTANSLSDDVSILLAQGPPPRTVTPTPTPTRASTPSRTPSPTPTARSTASATSPPTPSGPARRGDGCSLEPTTAQNESLDLLFVGGVFLLWMRRGDRARHHADERQRFDAAAAKGLPMRRGGLIGRRCSTKGD